MKIVIFGGSFNPIHSAHISIARKVYNELKPSKFFFVPTYKHPLKKDVPFLPYDKRCYLVKKAIQDLPMFDISYLDKNETEPSYTFNLIKRFKKLFPNAIFYFIIGEDIIYELTLWYNYKWLLKNIKFVVLTRPTKDKKSAIPDFAKEFIYINIKPINISSTFIREKIKKGESIKNLVPPNIEKDVIKFYSSFLSNK